ncbi:hypothetical protein JN531_013705 [Flagellatimonas centrodinii]|uniref:hypothetical protein n=1 Tax=Flagellatimonas centrodinii TaxID=2806210 RepID=UPI001FED728D|nr:hypothetical protein [Flagellatimonas centrodinii]ULQ46150.1 hypothetical protein JN531_013705 [Flagellatimonas centrodinii]
MSPTTLLPWLAALLFLAYGVQAALRPVAVTASPLPPLLLSLLFAGLSAAAVAQEGLFGFWPEHVRSLWANQIWVDLLLAAGIAWTLLLPRLRAAGMSPLPWFVLIACSGSLGLLLALARLSQREAQAGAAVGQ